ncbi:very-long-chain enoyl-CoA reductase isoform X3 [Taeniopygia guttata]|uniref:very-long-chain enoyl-CoA reductase isoform X3 n=1 Tax=Taeniopygia guttata TaxID=59729 RepID=UPI003BB8F846
MKHYEVEILDARSREKLCFLDKVEPQATVADIKNLFSKSHPQWYPARQSLRLDPKGRSLKDEDVLQSLPVGTTATLYFRDLGAQISWVTVFLTEYAGPLLIYLLFYFRVPFLYGARYDFTASRHRVVHLACCCHSFHYVKRLLETLFVHRFSHGTMPLRNIFKNCTYYWGFAAWMAYYINHPLYTPPVLPTRELLHPRGPEEPPARGLEGAEDPVPDPEPVHVAVPAGVLPQLHLRGRLLDRFHHHDAVPARGAVLAGGLCADGDLGSGQTPQLPARVPGLSPAALAHRPLPAVTPWGHRGDTAHRPLPAVTPRGHPWGHPRDIAQCHLPALTHWGHRGDITHRPLPAVTPRGHPRDMSPSCCDTLGTSPVSPSCCDTLGTPWGHPRDIAHRPLPAVTPWGHSLVSPSCCDAAGTSRGHPQDIPGTSPIVPFLL